jgi:hypothetical protein
MVGADSLEALSAPSLLLIESLPTPMSFHPLVASSCCMNGEKDLLTKIRNIILEKYLHGTSELRATTYNSRNENKMLNTEEWLPSHTPCIWLHEQLLFLSLLPSLQKGYLASQVRRLIISTMKQELRGHAPGSKRREIYATSKRIPSQAQKADVKY